MQSCLCVSFRFLHGAFHGRGDGAGPEWPPSPLRAFQALVQAAARLEGGPIAGELAAALEWLEAQPPPIVFAPSTRAGRGYCLSVPNNAMDIVAAFWSRGNYSNSGDASPATHRTMKTVRPTWFVDGDSVCYVWSVKQDNDCVVNVITRLARAVAVLGWGIDTVVGNVALVSAAQVDQLGGERWNPAESSDHGLRVPIAGTLRALKARHDRFLSRMTPVGFAPPPTLQAFARVAYRRPTDLPGRPAAVFTLLKADASAMTSFDPVRRGLTLAGMIRHAVRRTAEGAGWDTSTIDAVVLGHWSPSDHEGVPAASPRRRFAYVPLPSIEPRSGGRSEVAGRIRRALVCAHGPSCESDIRWLRKGLPGTELIREQDGRSVGILSLTPTNDSVASRYLAPATTWASVTPVVLPGFDDPAHLRRRLEKGPSAEEQRELLARLDHRIDALLRKALLQAGYSQALVDHAELDWRPSGFWAGADLASRYGVPDHLRRFPRLHVRLRWLGAEGTPLALPGPVCVGSGRFYGVGLFAGC